MKTKITHNKIVLFFSAFVFLTLILLTANISYSKSNAVQVTDIRYRSGPNYTRVVIDLSKKTEFTYHLLKKDTSINKPRRFYVDLADTTLSNNISTSIPVNDGLLKEVRAGQFNSSTVRVVLDIETLEDYTIFPLTNPYRIVIDITGKGLLKKKSKESVSSVPSLPEPSPVPGAPVIPVIKGTSKAKATPVKKGPRIRTIVIDAGHGGKDPGAMGKKKLKEKDMALKIVKRLKKELSKKVDAKIVLTRDRDVFIPLDERTAIANSKEADMFVSIHLNASPNRKASGVETYILGEPTDKEALRVSARENAASPEEMSDIVQFIVRDLEMTGTHNESVRLATLVQDSLSTNLKKNYSGVKSNGVKKALFYVLVRSNMPSILVETTFISNPRDEKRLKTDKYIDTIVAGISKGIVAYINGDGAL